IDLATIIVKSSNVGTSKVALQLGASAVWDMFYRAGLGQATGIELPGEAVGSLPNYPRWPKVRLAALSYGYGLAVTPLQLAQGYQVLANDGVRAPVSLMAGGSPVAEPEAVMPVWVARQMRDVLAKVVKKGGTGTRAALENWQVAGKTGTVHRVGAEGYLDDRYTAVFAGFAPADTPRIVTVVVINGPSKGEYYGGEVAAPVFRRVVASALRILNVQPEQGAYMRVADGGAM
ncbi:MAG: penicillin-binding protein 2, partial [Gammaproteobacteria bacterium]